MWKLYFLRKIYFFSEIVLNWKSKKIYIYLRNLKINGYKFKGSVRFLKDNKFMLEKSEVFVGGCGWGGDV